MNKTTWESTVKPVVVLSVISLVVSLLLAVVNSMTAPVIAENERAATLAAYVDVMPSVSDANTLEEMSGYTSGIGSNVAKADYLAQFNGMDGTQNIVMNQDFDAYSGATISSTALFAAINDCISCYNELA